jgi:hypothetical protein
MREINIIEQEKYATKYRNQRSEIYRKRKDICRVRIEIYVVEESRDIK